VDPPHISVGYNLYWQADSNHDAVQECIIHDLALGIRQSKKFLTKFCRS
jgi:hypothetical protein